MSEARTASTGETPTQSGFGTGWRVVARKEFADHIRSARFMVLAGVFGIVALACVFAASGGIRSLATQAMGDPAIFLRLLTLQNEPVPYPLITLFMGFLGPLLGIAFGFDAISSERSQGTLPRLLSQPIHRDEVIIGKFVAGLGIVGVMLVAMVSFIAGVGMFRLG
ncbi:MAG: ABC transporter permease, partial [Acidimicrobiia bacterium]